MKLIELDSVNDVSNIVEGKSCTLGYNYRINSKKVSCEGVTYELIVVMDKNCEPLRAFYTHGVIEDSMKEIMDVKLKPGQKRDIRQLKSISDRCHTQREMEENLKDICFKFCL